MLLVWIMTTYPALPVDSILLAIVTSFDQMSNCHFLIPIKPLRIFPEWTPILMSMFSDRFSLQNTLMKDLMTATYHISNDREIFFTLDMYHSLVFILFLWEMSSFSISRHLNSYPLTSHIVLPPYTLSSSALTVSFNFVNRKCYKSVPYNSINLLRYK